MEFTLFMTLTVLVISILFMLAGTYYSSKNASPEVKEIEGMLGCLVGFLGSLVFGMGILMALIAYGPQRQEVSRNCTDKQKIEKVLKDSYKTYKYGDDLLLSNGAKYKIYNDDYKVGQEICTNYDVVESRPYITLSGIVYKNRDYQDRD